MAKFIEEIARHLLLNNEENLKTTTVIVPNRRTGLFIQKTLANMAQKPVWSPHFYSPSSFFASKSPLILADPLSLIANLYTLHQRITQSKETFTQFYHWGEVILDDFNLVDKSLAAASQIFSTLKSAKEVEARFPSMDPEKKALIQRFWLGFEPKPSPMQLNFLKLWQALPELYDQFTNELLTKGLAYEGLLQRNLIESKIDFNLPGDVVIAGFSRISAVEKALFVKLKQDYHTAFFWDSPGDGVPGHDWIKTLAGFYGGIVLSSDQKPNYIHWYSGDREEGQAACLAGLLSAGTETAVIFPKPSLLPPVLQRLSSDFNDLNISLGFPLVQTLTADFIHQLNTLALNSKGGSRIASESLWMVLQHPFMREYITEEIQKWMDSTKETSRPYLYLNKDEFPESFSTLLQITRNESPLSTLLTWLPSFKPSDTIEQQALLTLIQKLNRIADVLPTLNTVPDAYMVWKLIIKTIRSTQIPVLGEPVSGTQLLGMMETQGLEFENLYFLQANEGALPPSDREQSLIPYYLKKAFELPVYEDLLEWDAYLFYRLCSRAQNIILISNSTQDGMEKGEPSRYLLQLKHRSPYSLPVHISIGSPASPAKMPGIESIQKSGNVLDALLAYKNNAGISPSAINTYITCPMKFYLSYLARVTDKDSSTPEIDQRLVGDLYHKAVQILYSPFLNKWVGEEEFKRCSSIAIIDQAISKALAHFFKSNTLPVYDEMEGQWLVIWDVLRQYIDKTVAKDQMDAPILFETLEVSDSFYFSLSETEQVQLKGTVDRTDTLRSAQGLVRRILDYKTGNNYSDGIKNKLIADSIEQIFNPNEPVRSEMRQVLIYSLVLHQKYPNDEIAPGLLFIKNPDFHKMDSRLVIGDSPVTDVRPYLQEIESALRKTLNELFDPSFPFTKTEDEKRCAWCSFAMICGRQ